MSVIAWLRFPERGGGRESISLDGNQGDLPEWEDDY